MLHELFAENVVRSLGLALLIAFAPLPAASSLAFEVVALTNDARLVRFDSRDPSRLLGSVAVSGLEAGERLESIDRNPDGLLAGLAVGPSGFRVYLLDRITGRAGAVHFESMPVAGATRWEIEATAPYLWRIINDLPSDGPGGNINNLVFHFGYFSEYGTVGPEQDLDLFLQADEGPLVALSAYDPWRNPSEHGMGLLVLLAGGDRIARLRGSGNPAGPPFRVSDARPPLPFDVTPDASLDWAGRESVFGIFEVDGRARFYEISASATS